jgi:hypothetical protein
LEEKKLYALICHRRCHLEEGNSDPPEDALIEYDFDERDDQERNRSMSDEMDQDEDEDY